MYSYEELNAVELSPTKKDYYQIWAELLDISSKLSERWNPVDSNESDPGVVLLKVLTAVADKLSYNIDVNTLEAFLPSAAQEASVRKLCAMLGYAMRYYQSASTEARITYSGDRFPSDGIIRIDRFTNLRDRNNTINYVTTDEVLLTEDLPSAVVNCIEGELIACAADNGGTIGLAQLDDNYRYWLPERQVASNGIFIARADTPLDFWTRVDNLNTRLLGEHVFEFGFEASTGLPFIQFPEDISSLVGSGLIIKFVRTKGAAGNIAAGVLKILEKPQSWSESTTETEDSVDVDEYMKTVEAENATEATHEESEDEPWLNLENYNVYNIKAAKTGKDPETIDEAYWNYQKTIGTFDTLVTCRDYMNKIYNMTVSNTPLVSNIIVSDIRDDINSAVQICTYEPAGVLYKSTPIASSTNDNRDQMTHFDLKLYPFTYQTTIASDSSFNTTFRIDKGFLDKDAEKRYKLLQELEDNKTLAHNIKFPETNEIACIKVYSEYSARINTTTKVSETEAFQIQDAVRSALFKQFNARNLNFGEEIPFEQVQQTILSADTRIKNISLDDPQLYVAIEDVSGKEYPLFKTGFKYDSLKEAETAKNYYVHLIARNILAGRSPLLNISDEFAVSYLESRYPSGLAETDTTASNIVISEEGGIVFKNSSSGTAASKTLSAVKVAESKDEIELYDSDCLIGVTATNVGIGDKAGITNVISKPKSFIANTRGYLTMGVYPVYPPNVDATDPAALKLLEERFHNICNIISIKLLEPGAANTDACCELQICPIMYTTDAAEKSVSPMWKISIIDSANATAINMLSDTLVGTTNLFKISLDSDATKIIPLFNKPGTNSAYAEHSLTKVVDKIHFSFSLNLQELSRLVKDTNTKDFNTFRSLVECFDFQFTWSAMTSTDGTDEKTIVYPDFLRFSDLENEDVGVEQTKKTTLITADTTTDLTALKNLADLKLTSYEATDMRIPNTIRPLFMVDPATLSDEDPLVLKNHEVIQFRAPNFRTSVTYPAYVNYFVHLDDSVIQYYTEVNGGQRKNIPATMYTLREFLSGGPDGYEDYLIDNVFEDSPGKPKKEKQEAFWSPAKSINEKVDSMPSTLKSSIFSQVYVTTGNDIDNDRLSELAKRHKLIYYKNNDKFELFAWYIKEPECIETGKYVYYKSTLSGQEIAAGTQLYSMNLTEEGLAGIANWVQGKSSANGKDPVKLRVNPMTVTAADTDNLTDLSVGPTIINGHIAGLFTRAQINMNNVPSRLIDANLYKYEQISSMPVNATLDSIFVPILYETTTDYYTKDGLGLTAKLSGIPANTEYLLKPNEYILLNYTTTEGTTNGESVVKNVYLGPGTIVKANFELLDSVEQSVTKSLYKTSGYGPWKNPKTGATKNASDIPGMYAFAAAEQLEVREPIIVKLNSDDTLLSWEVKDRYIYKTATDEELEAFPIGRITGRKRYVLKPGEYVFYTNSRQEGLAYYGAGSEISCTDVNAFPEIFRPASATISAQDLEDVGFVKAIPWVQASLASTDDKKTLTIAEYQQITLVEGDSLGYIELDTAANATSKLISDTPVPVKSANYISGGQPATLPMFEIAECGWEVSSGLELAVGPDVPQDLGIHKNKYGKEIARDLLCLERTIRGANELIHVYTPLVAPRSNTHQEQVLRLYVDTPINCGGDAFVLKQEDKITVASLKDRKFITFKACVAEPDLKLLDGATTDQGVLAGNVGQKNEAGFRQLIFKDDASSAELDINLVIPEGSVGVLEIYYQPDSLVDGEVPPYLSYMTYSEDDNLLYYDYKSNLTIVTEENSWWPEFELKDTNDPTPTKFVLKPGLNPIQVPKTGRLTLSVGKASSIKTLLLGTANLVKKTLVKKENSTQIYETLLPQNLFTRYTQSFEIAKDDPYNPIFDYKFQEEGSDEILIKTLSITPDDILTAVKNLDINNLFYILDTGASKDIESPFNTKSILHPLVWFDKQNVNNKFVLSVLDTQSITDNIYVSRFSRRL